MANKDHGHCDCIFCNSKCPECGSTDIHAMFTVDFDFRNETQDSISIDHTFGMMTLDCDECGESFFNDDRLTGLQNAFHTVLDLPGSIHAKYKKGGKIEISRTISF